MKLMWRWVGIFLIVCSIYSFYVVYLYLVSDGFTVRVLQMIIGSTGFLIWGSSHLIAYYQYSNALRSIGIALVVIQGVMATLFLLGYLTDHILY